MKTAFVIGFRDRGTDPLRQANLTVVKDYVEALGLGPLYIVSDGREGTANFNRHAAYNIGADIAFRAGASTVTFYESDMIVSREQLAAGISAALEQPGLVVPFTARHEFGPRESQLIRAGTDPASLRAKIVKPKPRRTGAINIVSPETYTAVGRYDEAFEGSWFDDRSMHLAFDICAGPTRWIDGPSYHLYHLPGYEGRHLTPEDKAATQANRQRFHLYQQARTPQQIHQLTMETA